jgi:hypothetical protein
VLHNRSFGEPIICELPKQDGEFSRLVMWECERTVTFPRTEGSWNGTVGNDDDTDDDHDIQIN